MNKHSGFTLIELSIVLVIIGLIVGGILVGQTLIESAEIKKTITQKEGFETATNAFRLKYNCLPGDCVDAFTLGLASAANGAPAYGEAGDGSGVIGDAGDTLEASAFWYHLSEANLIGWVHPTGIIAVPTAACGVVSPCLAKSYTAFNGQKAGWWIHSTYSGVFITNTDSSYTPGHYLWMAGSVGQAAVNDAAVFTPLEAYRIDVKIDDGAPLTGGVFAAGDVPHAVYGPTNATVGVVDADGTCIINAAAPREYSVNTFLGDGTAMCSLLIKTSF